MVTDPYRWRVSPSARAAARMLESIDANGAVILPHGANPDRIKFSERTGLDRPTFQRFDEAAAF
jgi:hypothetical protein